MNNNNLRWRRSY